MKISGLLRHTYKNAHSIKLGQRNEKFMRQRFDHIAISYRQLILH